MRETTTGFGAKLKLLRKRKGLSQSAAAKQFTEQTGHPMTQTNMSHLERRTEAPRQALLEPLCTFYGVPILHFFRGDTGTDWSKRRDQVAKHIASLRDRAFVDAPKRAPRRGDKYTILDNPWFRKDEYP